MIVVADRGMISRKVLDLLTGDARAPFDSILGCRLRQDLLVADEVLARAGRYHPVDGRTSLQVTAGVRPPTLVTPLGPAAAASSPSSAEPDLEVPA